MFKKIISLGVMLIMLFSFTACDNSKELEQYKAAAKQELETYANDKGQDNYSAENWEVIMTLVVEGKAEIDAANDKAGVDAVSEVVKEAMDTILSSKEESALSGAVMYDRAVEWRNDEFYKANLVSGGYEVAYYEDNGDYLIVDEDVPTSKTFIVRNQAEFESMFTALPQEIKFENEMLLLYIFTDIYTFKSYDIKRVSLANKTIEVDFEIVKLDGSPIASMPIIRWLAVKIDKLDITGAKFMGVPIQ